MQNASKLDSEGAPVLALQNIPGATLAYIYIELLKKGPMVHTFQVLHAKIRDYRVNHLLRHKPVSERRGVYFFTKRLHS